MNFSVCISVYKNDVPANVAASFDSIVNQTMPPSEIILIVDGPISEDLNSLISMYANKYNIIKKVYLPVNVGLGKVLALAVNYASYDIIARMDSDDIALSDRFEKQIKCFEVDPKLSIVGGAINEFIDNPLNVVAQRVCPTTDKEIKKYMKSRCGFNHMTVMFKKEDILKVGNYQCWFWNEDYYLWIRMLQAGCKFKNLRDVLVNVRVGKDMYARRGGIKYFLSEIKLQKYMLENNVISFSQYCFNVLVRFIVQILMPNNIRAFVFQKILRRKI